MPLTKQWHAIFITYRVVVIGSATLAFVTYWSLAVVPRSWVPGTLIALAGEIVVYVVSHTLYAGLRPKGTVHLSPEGEPWVELRDVHPHFVEAINAYQPAPRQSLEPTGKVARSQPSRVRLPGWLGPAIALTLLVLVSGVLIVPAIVGSFGHSEGCPPFRPSNAPPPPAVSFDVALPFAPVGMSTDGCDWSIVWMVSRQERALWRYKRDVGSVEGPFHIDGAPAAVASDELNTVWVALESGQVQAIDASTKRVVASLQVGANPVSILAGGGAIWVVNQGSDSVTRIDPKSKRVSGTLSTGVRPGRAVVCCGGLLWVANEGDDTVSVFDVGSLKQKAVVAVSGAPTGIIDESFLETNPPVWALLADGTIEQIDETKFVVVKSRLVSPKPIAGLGLVHALLVVSEDGTVWVIDDSPKKSFDGDHQVVGGREAGVVGVAEGSGVRGRHQTLWIGNSKLKSLSFIIAT